MLFRAHLNLISRHFGLGWSDQRFFLRRARSDQRSLPDGTSTCKFLQIFVEFLQIVFEKFSDYDPLVNKYLPLKIAHGASQRGSF